MPSPSLLNVMRRGDLLARRSSPNQAIFAGIVLASLGLIVVAWRLAEPTSAFDDGRGTIATVLAPLIVVVGAVMLVDGFRRRGGGSARDGDSGVPRRRA